MSTNSRVDPAVIPESAAPLPTDDWLIAAAAEACQRVGDRVRPRFGKRHWSEFSTRLSATGEELFRILHGLYGWRYDFAWVFEEMVEVAAGGYLDRSPSLHRVDREAASPPAWMGQAASLWGMGYLDRYALNAKGLDERVDHLETVGITHLHLLPPYRISSGPNDGGFAVSDVRHLRADLGTAKQFSKAAKNLRAHGIGLVLDLICNHTSFDHPWAVGAAGGDPSYRDFYFLFPDRTGPDRFAPRLRKLDPTREGDAFTWHPLAAGGSWVWTTFHPDQWDLDYTNPRVLAAMSGEMLFLANLGAGVIRMSGSSFVWKREGTTCEDLPEAHQVLAAMRCVADLAAPSVVFASGGTMRREDDRTGSIFPLGYNAELATGVWDALATGDTRFLRLTLGERFPLPRERVWLTYLHTHEDLTWVFSDDDIRRLGADPGAHRHYLTEYYTGQFPGSDARGVLSSANGGGIAGTLASLAGLEKAIEEMDPAAIETACRRILAAFALLLGNAGLPVVYLGDEIGQLSDHAYLSDESLALDTRWIHRTQFDLDRFERGRAGEGPEGKVLSGLRRLLEVRKTIPDFGPGTFPVVFDVGDQRVIAFRRGGATVVVNLSPDTVLISRSALPTGDLFDQITADTWDGHILTGYEYRFLLG